MDRPSKKEIDCKIELAITLIKRNNFRFSNPRKNLEELFELEIENIEQVVLDLLEEISLDDYKGKRPPERSYEPLIAHCELWAFAWHSLLFKNQMYLKFALKNEIFYLVSLHASKFPPGEE